MARYVGTVTTDRPREEVFDYLADFASVAEWDPGVKEARPLDGAGGAPGATFEVVSRFLARDVTLVYRTVEYERPRRVVLEARSGTVVSHDAITFRELAGGGTEVTYDADLRLRGPLRVADLPLRLVFDGVGDRARAGLEEALSRAARRARR